MKIRDSNIRVIEVLNFCKVLVYAAWVLHNTKTKLGSKRRKWVHNATI
jgi:hypothetical protein